MDNIKLKCGQCKHFRGWGDWGLCCELKWGLCYEETEACELFVLKKENKDGNII